MLRFRDMEQFLAAVEGRDEVQKKLSTPAQERPIFFDPNNPIVDPLSNLPAGSRIERHFMRRVAFLPDGTVVGETDNGPHKFTTFEEWRRSIGK